MASRPVFVPEHGKPFVREASVEFTWYPGFSVAQKQRSIASLHSAAASMGLSPLLEISGASQDSYGRSLSAFHLLLTLPGMGRIPVECAFQGSKVFRDGGPYHELYGLRPRDAKMDPRLRSSGPIIKFRLQDEEWSTTPMTAFYDWLYLSALSELGSEAERLLSFAGFTDIQFNPERSLNCQARSAALYVALSRNGSLAEALASKENFLRLLSCGDGATRDCRLSLF